MKKLLSFLISIALIGCVTACGNKTLSAEQEQNKIANSKIGNYVKFGKSNVEWLVLDKKDNKVLLIMKHVLLTPMQHFGMNDKGDTFKWSNSLIRNYLNNKFLDDNFSLEEQDLILNTDNSSTECGYAIDKIFLLSRDEAQTYFSSNKKRIATYKSGSAREWWLRSKPTSGTQTAMELRFAYVTKDGQIGTTAYGGGCVDGFEKLNIRPALWISIK